MGRRAQERAYRPKVPLGSHPSPPSLPYCRRAVMQRYKVPRAARPRRTHMASTPRSEVHFERVEATDMAVDGEDDATIVDEYVVDLAGAGRCALDLRAEMPDLFRLVRVRQIVGPQSAGEERAKHDVVGFPAAR